MTNGLETILGEYSKTSRIPRPMEKYKGHRFFITQLTGLDGRWTGVFEDVDPGYECTRYPSANRGEPARSKEEARLGVIRWIDYCDNMKSWSRSRPNY